SDVTNGTLSLNTDGTFSYTADTNFTGSDSFTYTVTDSASGESDIRTVDLTINTITDLSAQDDSFTTDEDVTLNADVSINDSTTSGGNLSYALDSDVTNGTLSLNTDGTFSYTADTNFTGSDSFTYTVTDSASGESDIRTVDLTITAVTDLSAADDSFTTDEEVTLNADVSINDSTTSGGSLSYALDSDVANGTLSLNTDGTFSYTADANFNGSDSFTYTVTDSASGESAIRTVDLTITAVTDLSAADDSFTTDEDVTLNADVSINDSTTSGGSLSYALDSDVANGTLSLNTDGTFTYTADANFNGSDSFTYTVTDSASGESDIRTVTLNVSAINDAAIVSGDDTANVTEDVDPNGDNWLERSGILTISDVDVGQSNFVAGTISGTYGTLTIDTVGNWKYVADNSQVVIQQLDQSESVTDIFTVTTADGTTHNVYITIDGVNEVTVIDNTTTDNTTTDNGTGDLGGPVDLSDTGEITDSEQITPDFPSDEDVLLDQGIDDEKDDSKDLPVVDFESIPPEDNVPSEDETVISLIPLETEMAGDSLDEDDLTTNPGEQSVDYLVSSDQLSAHSKPSESNDTQRSKESLADTLLEGIKRVEKEALEFLSVPLSVDALYLEPTDSVGAVTENKALRAGLDAMHEEMEEAFREAEEEQKISVYMTSGVSVTIAAGALSYLLRAGSLMSSFLATVPLWKGFDPVAILLTPKKKKKKDQDTFADSVDQLESAVEQKAEKMFSEKENK
ncbi:tandem-95 repeat protein, partial [Desulforhopalus sp. IMCC35007]|uniref:tandem-95 repeat protein n=1 Tax=Desulforhopalus sp. IMCC35007 TaxID=2569543 RepID=UPI0010AE4231